MDDIKVSVVCMTYNQEDYIADALESFIMQKTNFKFEVIVHDDASTDRTADIVREYEKKYPDIIKPVYQKENQYSKSVKIGKLYVFPKCKGKYIAVCEGDDYWTDPNKLQKQYDYMEAHPDCTLCVHGAVYVKADNKDVIKKNVLYNKITKLDIKDAIGGLGRNIATNSYFYRYEICTLRPEYRTIAPCGDYTLAILCAEYGYIAYLPDIMCAHRTLANSSLSKSWADNPSSKLRYNEKCDAMLTSLDEHTDHKYSDLIEKERCRLWGLFYLRTGNKKKLREEPYKSYFKGLPLKQYFRYLIELNIPGVIEIARKSKHGVIRVTTVLKGKNKKNVKK